MNGRVVADDSRKARLLELAQLYDEIWDWACAKYDPELAKRRIEAVDPDSRLFIVGEAHAQNQVRLTGINWFNRQGTLGSSGEKLDMILRCLRYTVYPPTSIHFAHSSVQRKESELTTVYTTDLFPCYPPGGGTPTPAMVADALKQRFLIREFEILQPKVVLFLGRHSYTAFYTHLLRTARVGKISTEFEVLSPDTRLAEYKGALVVPFLHPSGASRIFSQWYEDSRSTLCSQPQIQAISAAVTR